MNELMNELIDELIKSFLKRYTTVSDLSDAETVLRALTLLAFTSTKVQILTHLADPPPGLDGGQRGADLRGLGEQRDGASDDRSARCVSICTFVLVKASKLSTEGGNVG
jgi:hypothetical protein